MGVPALVAFACGGRTGDELPLDFLPSSNGGAGNGTAFGGGAFGSGAQSALGPASTGGKSTSSGSGTTGRGVATGPTTGPTGVGNGPMIGPPPPIGAGGVIVFPPFGAGGFVGAGGAFPFGGTGGIYTGPTQCVSSKDMSIEYCPSPITPIDTCCTADNHCGIQIASDPVPTNVPFRGGCQRLNQVGTPDPNCPSFTQLLNAPNGIAIPGCCRPDGTCGLDLSLLGAGCVQSQKGGAPMACGVYDAGAPDASPPPVDAGRD